MIEINCYSFPLQRNLSSKSHHKSHLLSFFDSRAKSNKPKILSMASKSIKLSLILLLTIFITSKAELGQIKETNMTLYFQDWSGGPNATVLQITGHQDGPLSFAKFGSVFVTDDPVTEAFDKNSAEIARAQGIYVTSALDGKISHVLISIIFTNEYYKWSTLEIQGASPQFERVRDVAVVGGTGKFRLARGYATFETIHFDLAVHYVVIQCNVTILHY